jgi:hypothetical protein
LKQIFKKVSFCAKLAKCLIIKIQAVSGVLSPGGFWDQKVFYFAFWFELEYKLIELYCNTTKMWFKLLKINVLNSIYLNKNAYICSGI